MDHVTMAALRLAIQMEKKGYDFYRRAAAMVADPKTADMFRLLAREEAEHVGTFLGRYPGSELGDLQSVMDRPSDPATPAYHRLLKAACRADCEKEALELALTEEQSCIDSYSALLVGLRDPEVRALFTHALAETRRHYLAIEEDYLRLAGEDGAAEMGAYAGE